ncbi:hypothetical protein APHAL10511_002211 [Amanita phalloides]|nr:hypothetical protein APHAL10511_002211 [Amanita phalloides]
MLLTLDETTLVFFNKSAKFDVTAPNSGRLNNWLTAYRMTPQDNTGIGGWSVTSTKKNMPHSYAPAKIQGDKESDVPPFEEGQYMEQASPVKKRRRLTCNSMVKAARKSNVNDVAVKKEPVGVSTTNSRTKGKAHENMKSDNTGQKKWRERETNRNLPPSLDKRLWHVAVLPTLLNFVGNFRDPWAADDKQIIAYMQPILNHFIPENKQYTLESGDIMVWLIHQRLNEWRSMFCSTSISILNAYFETNMYDTVAERKELLHEMLTDKKFLYDKTEMRNGAMRLIGIFRGPLVLQTFASHFKVVNNASTKIPGLECPKRLVGALALSAAAVECALQLWMKSSFRANEHSELLEVISMTSGRVHDFGTNKWREITATYVEIALQLNDARFNRIVAAAKRHMVSPGAKSGSVTSSATENAPEVEFDLEYDD